MERKRKIENKMKRENISILNGYTINQETYKDFIRKKLNNLLLILRFERLIYNIRIISLCILVFNRLTRMQIERKL